MLATLEPVANSRPHKDFQFDQPSSDGAREIVFGTARRLDAADIRKVDRAVGLYARGRVQLRMIDDADGDDIRSRENPSAASRRQRPRRREKQNADPDRVTNHFQLDRSPLRAVRKRSA